MKKLQVGSLFPNTDPIAGFYSATSFCITLKTITGRQLNEINREKVGHVEKRKLLHHEIKHHMDHLSTLWGHNRILALHSAVDAKLAKNEGQFYKMAEYKIVENQMHFYKYFTVSKGTATYESPLDRWAWKITSGLRFNHNGEICEDKPILLIHFRAPDGSAQMRVPLTIASLLEVNAIYEETLIEQTVLAQIEEKIQAKAKQAFINKLIKNVIYHQEMIEYNCALHLLANNFSIVDPYEAYDVTSSIASVALNLPSEFLQEMPINEEYMQVWGKRVNDFNNEHNYGFIFLNMITNYRTRYRETRTFDLTEFLAINNLPSRDELERIIIEKMQANIDAVVAGSYYNEFFQGQLRAGLTLFQRRGIDGKKEALKDTLISGEYIPFIVTSDMTFPKSISFDDVYKSDTIPSNISINDWYHLSADINQEMEEFYNICGI